MIDVAIIGGGPAGLSAALNVLQRNKTVMVFHNCINTLPLYKADFVDNYLGFSLSGKELTEKFFEHAKRKGVSFTEAKVIQIFSMDNYYSINAKNTFFEAKSIILATGITKIKKLDGEEKFLGLGVSRCATCDGMLFKNKKVVVITDTEEGFKDANFLSEICNEVILIPKKIFNIPLNKNIKIHNGIPKKIIGKNKVSGIELDNTTFNTDGIFIVEENPPIDSLIDGLEKENNFIKVNRNMETNLKNIYAAGDCTGGPFQVSKAVGEGLIAALNAVSNLD